MPTSGAVCPPRPTPRHVSAGRGRVRGLCQRAAARLTAARTVQLGDTYGFCQPASVVSNLPIPPAGGVRSHRRDCHSADALSP